MSSAANSVVVPMANVVVGHPFHVTQAHGQHRLGAIKGLDLRLLIHREHDGMIGRVQIKTHHIAHLFNEERIARQLEALAAVRLDGEGPKDSVYRGF